MDLEKLVERIDENANKIETNLEKIQKNSYAIEILGDYKEGSRRLFEINKRLYVLILILLAIIIALGIVVIVGA
jgi:ABC-type lipoprotein release transport system permease subunit